MNFGIIPASAAPYMHSLLRIVAGLLFMEHGTGKFFNFPPIQDAMAKALGSGMLYFTGAMEFIGGALILIGLFTRPVAFLLSGFMAAAFSSRTTRKTSFPRSTAARRRSCSASSSSISRRPAPGRSRWIGRSARA